MYMFVACILCLNADQEVTNQCVVPLYVIHIGRSIGRYTYTTRGNKFTEAQSVKIPPRSYIEALD